MTPFWWYVLYAVVQAAVLVRAVPPQRGERTFMMALYAVAAPLVSLVLFIVLCVALLALIAGDFE